MKEIGDLILISGVLLLVVSGILTFINSIGRNVIGGLLVLDPNLCGAGTSIKKKKSYFFKNQYALNNLIF